MVADRGTGRSGHCPLARGRAASDAAGGRRTFALVRGERHVEHRRTVRSTTGGSFAPAPAAVHAVRVTRQPNCVIDGDTIRLGGVKIRLEDIDAPEVFSPKCPSELARGNRATGACWS